MLGERRIEMNPLCLQLFAAIDIFVHIDKPGKLRFANGALPEYFS